MSLAAPIAVYFASSAQPATAVQSRVFLSEDILVDPCKESPVQIRAWMCLRENRDQHGDTVAELGICRLKSNAEKGKD